LLVPDEPWAGVRPLLDECWYADLDEPTRLRWLIQRHVDHGKTPEAAREWVQRSDQANAAVAAATRNPGRRRRPLAGALGAGVPCSAVASASLPMPT
jgi:pantothenate kinase